MSETIILNAPLTPDERRLLALEGCEMSALTNCAHGTDGAVILNLHRKGLMRCVIMRGERPEKDRYSYSITNPGRTALTSPATTSA